MGNIFIYFIYIVNNNLKNSNITQIILQLSKSIHKNMKNIIIQNMLIRHDKLMAEIYV